MAPLPPVNRGAKAPQRGAPTTQEKLARKGFQDLKNTSELKEFIEQNHPRLMAERDEIEEIAERNRLGRDPAVRIGRMPEMPVSSPGQLPPGFDDVLPPNFTQRTIVRPPVKEIDRTTETEVEADDLEDDWKDEEARKILKTLNVANLPVEHQKRIVAAQKKKNATEQANSSEPVKRKVISNVPTQDKNTPVNAPQPSTAQIRKQVEAEVRAELKAPPKEEPKSAPRFVIRSIPDPDIEDYESIPLVSDFVFYDFDRLDIRKFNLKDAVPLSNAKRERNIPNFLNAVGKTLLNVDIRDLTMPDLRYVLYWHQFNSFCQAGDTLIPTENGLMQIKELAGDVYKNKLKKYHVEPLNIKIGGRYSPEQAANWIYSGKAPSLHIDTYHGNALHCTYKHPNLVFNNSTGEMEWKVAKKCKIGDYLAINPVQITRTKPLLLNLEYPDIKKYDTSARTISKPEYMNTDLAFALALIIAEGSFDNNSVVVCNQDTELLNKFAVIMKKQFDIECSTHLTVKKGALVTINGVKTFANNDCYECKIYSRTLIQWLKDLGLYFQSGLRDGKTPSHFKQIPWSILQADKESQLSFIAAYLEGDGRVRNEGGELLWFSSSKELLQKFQLMLNSHGYVSCLSKNKKYIKLSAQQSKSLWQEISKYMVTKVLNERNHYGTSHVGVPSSFWQGLFKERNLKINQRKGVAFSDDNGKTIIFNKLSKKLHNLMYRNKSFTYDAYENGYLDELLELLKQISLSGYTKLITLLNLKYHFTKITGIKVGDIIPVYDISMKDGAEPAFIANGLIVHNTRTPMNIRWQSKYGNENYYKISDRDLNYVKPSLTREQYRNEWMPLGLTYSTVRDWEFMENNDITSDEFFLVERAQWFKGDPSDSSFQSKIDAMTMFCGKSLDSINALPEFIEAAKHRVEEWINVTDIQFDPNRYLKVLEKQQEILQARREELGGEDLFEIESLNDDIVVIETQINDINETLEKKEAVEPDLERISLNIGILDFFPGL